MPTEVIALDPCTYRPHPLHGPGRVWTETNCAADLWIEVLHALGFDPVAGLAFTLSGDFDGAQWRMFTFAPEVLRSLYGIEVDELNVWRPLRRHLAEELALGHPVAFDADAWWLPDTAGLTYRAVHHKTTVCAQMVDVGACRLGYFHNGGYYELDGEDFDGLLPADPDPAVLAPFSLQIRLDDPPGRPAAPVRLGPAGLRHLAAEHLARRPADNPVVRLAERAAADLDELRAGGLDAYHRWAFGTLRQCGAGAELAASFVRRVGSGGRHAPAAADRFDQLATGVKAAELGLARAVRGRPVAPGELLAPAATAWSEAMELVAEELAPELGRCLQDEMPGRRVDAGAHALAVAR